MFTVILTLNTMTTLEKIARYITESRFSEKEAYEILRDYFRVELEKAWKRGWMRRTGLARACKRANMSSNYKNFTLEEFMVDYEEVDYKQPLAPDTLVRIDNDILEVKYLKKDDVIFLPEGVYEIRDVRVEDGKILLKY